MNSNHQPEGAMFQLKAFSTDDDDGGKESCIESVASVMLKPLPPPHDCSSEPSEQSFERSHSQPFGMHCSPLLHKNSLLGQKVFLTRKIV